MTNKLTNEEKGKKKGDDGKHTENKRNRKHSDFHKQLKFAPNRRHDRNPMQLIVLIDVKYFFGY